MGVINKDAICIKKLCKRKKSLRSCCDYKQLQVGNKILNKSVGTYLPDCFFLHNKRPFKLSLTEYTKILSYVLRR